MDETEVKILECQASDHEYLHKDFHGALCQALRYLDDNYGAALTNTYLEQLAKTVFSTLSDRLRQIGLAALEEHWREIFAREGGKFSLKYEADVLVLTVQECPAIANLIKNNTLATTRFCETTAIINRCVCDAAHYQSNTVYQPGQGRCEQRFWKKRGS